MQPFNVHVLGDHVDQSKDIEILIGNSSYENTTSKEDWDIEVLIITANISGIMCSLNSSRVFQYIVLRKRTSVHMSICEVKLYSTGEFK